MKFCTSLMLALGLSLIGALAHAEDEPNPYLSQEEHKELISLLDESFDLLVGLISGLSDEQWRFQQNPDRWSVAECAEHIIRSERALLDSALLALGEDPVEDWQEATKGKTELLRRVMPNRQPMGRGGATAPFEIRPTEKWSRSKTIEEFYKIRGVVRGYVEELDRPVKSHIAVHPFEFFGKLNAHDWLIYVPLHTIRHSRQIIEVQEDENYPKSARSDKKD